VLGPWWLAGMTGDGWKVFLIGVVHIIASEVNEHWLYSFDYHGSFEFATGALPLTFQ
jgi:hypothetical protein